jgi:hypothetical protein
MHLSGTLRKDIINKMTLLFIHISNDHLNEETISVAE